MYIDGFNLYYGAVRNSQFKWLDLKALVCKLLKPYHNILSIKYYTAPVKPINDPKQPLRQQTYIKALKAYISEVSIYYGHFIIREVNAKLVEPLEGKKYAKVYRTEEKGSDVNLAVHLVMDAWNDEYDCAVVISNDGDLSEALQIAKNQFGKNIGLINPQINSDFSRKLYGIANFKKRIRKGVIKDSQLPDPIPGTNIHKPKIW